MGQKGAERRHGVRYMPTLISAPTITVWNIRTFRATNVLYRLWRCATFRAMQIARATRGGPGGAETGGRSLGPEYFPL